VRASAEVIFSALTGGGFLVAVSLLGDAPLGLPLCLLVIIALVVGHSASLIARGSPNSFLEVAQKREHARMVGPLANLDYLLRRVRAKREALSLALRHGYSAIGVNREDGVRRALTYSGEHGGILHRVRLLRSSGDDGSLLWTGQSRRSGWGRAHNLPSKLPKLWRSEGRVLVRKSLSGLSLRRSSGVSRCHETPSLRRARDRRIPTDLSPITSYSCVS